MSASKGDIGSDLAKVDAYENAVADFEELPELTDADFARGVVHVGGRPARGRPPTRSAAKKQVTLRLDPDAVAKFKATGAGWQSRIDAVVVNAAKRLTAWNCCPCRGQANGRDGEEPAGSEERDGRPGGAKDQSHQA